MLPCAPRHCWAPGGLVSEVSTRNLGLDGFAMPAVCPPLRSTKRHRREETCRLVGRPPRNDVVTLGRDDVVSDIQRY